MMKSASDAIPSIWRHLAIVCGVTAICGALAVSYMIGAEAYNAQLEQAAQEIADENALFCTGAGATQETRTYEQCVKDLKSLRDRHESRVRSEITGIL